MGTHTSLDAIRSAESILDVFHLADDLTIAATRDGGPRSVRLLVAAAHDVTDQLTGVAAVHALAQVFDASADAALVSLLEHDANYLREHAAWSFGARLPRLDAIAGLVILVIGGGFSGMIAQRTLEQWSTSAPDHVALAVEGALVGTSDPDARARLVETLGLTGRRIARRVLRRIAADPREATAARSAAIAGLGDRGAEAATEPILDLLTRISGGTDELADVARMALSDLDETTFRGAPWNSGMTIAQLFLHADIDRGLSQVGSGDNGGIATLLVQLGDALVANGAAVRADGIAAITVAGTSASPSSAWSPEGGAAGRSVGRVLTLSRGTHRAGLDGLDDVSSPEPGHVFAPVPFVGEPVPSAEAWTRRIAAQRGIRRILRAAGSVDAIHLRMADVGTLAASTVAREFDIPVVFTVAPDPHSVIRALDRAGVLTRANFGETDEREHFWFRERLVRRIASNSAHTVLFPRPELRRDMRELVGIDIAAHPERHTVVAEGIDLDVIARSGRAAVQVAAENAVAEHAAADHAATGVPPLIVPGPRIPSASSPLDPESEAAFAALDEVLSALPASRRGLPLAISVGRLQRVKGMATLASAWAADDALRARCNLLIVGGDLLAPTSDERGVIEAIASVLPLDTAAEQGLLLAGHRANGIVARWLAAARFGRPGLAAANGVYVCASMKEEFGIALLEAMATGLSVVAPAAGGPATYVENGVTGFLVDTTDPRALAAGITAALDTAAGPFGEEFATRASEMVASTFTIQSMATALAGVYRDVADTRDGIAADWALAGS